MPYKRITDEQREDAWQMYDHGNGESIKYIAKSLGVSYTSALNMTRGRERGFDNLTEYQEHLAKQRGFKNYGEYQEHLAQQKGFNSTHEYQEHLAKQRGFKNYGEYQEHLAQQKGFNSTREYQEHLAKQKGFNSYYEYQEHLARERSQRRENKELSSLIKSRLGEIGKNQSWLAENIGVSRQMVSNYIHGKSIPSDDKLNGIYEVLGIELEETIDGSATDFRKSLDRLVDEGS
jgi:ribosome-binding protein aMBF1 (putative translation factor)